MSTDRSLPEKILAAAGQLFASQGVAATTMDAVAERAGCSRMTVYRHFAGKQALLQAVVLHGLTQEIARLDAVWKRPDPLEDRIVAGFVWGVETGRANPILGQLLRSEPESLLMSLTIEGEGALALATNVVAERLQSDEFEPEVAQTLAEILCRLILSMLLQRYGRLRLETRAELEEFARTWIVPALGPALQMGGAPTQR